MPKKITLNDLAESIDALAIATKNGFDRVEKVLDEHTKILDEHTEILTGHTRLHNDHTSRLNRIETRQVAEQDMLDSHDKRISRTEKHIGLKS